ncbi:MAG TPA: hypothetical protein VFW40_05375 [Capsulimonadaceae bacterium]|nr:hypothetical protein [Capsulimonadaceae bacterium]
MMPFESYPCSGKVLLGRSASGNCRSGYGLDFQRKIGQTSCAYCGMSLVDTFEQWLQMALDHVVPASVCRGLGIHPEWYDDCINKVLACAACNTFGNRYKPPAETACPTTLEAFCTLRDRIFADREERIETRRELERVYYEQRSWEK